MIDESVDGDILLGAVVATVNRRLARALHQSYQENRAAERVIAWETPAILPLDAWLHSLYARLVIDGKVQGQLLDPDQEMLIWQDILETSSVPLLNPVATARGLSRAFKTLQSYSSQAAPDEHYAGDDHRQFLRWSAEFTTRLDQQGWLVATQLPAVIIEHQNHLRDAGLLPQTLHLAGFSQLSPQLLEFFASMVMQDASVLTSLSPQLPQSVVAKINPVAELPILPEPADALASDRVGKCVFADAEQELDQLANWCREKIEKDPGHRIGVVVPDLHQRRQSVLRAFDRTFFPAQNPASIIDKKRPYDVSLGKPLADWPVVASAMLILSMGIRKLEQPDLTRFIVSPYLERASTEQTARASFDRELRKQGKRSMTVDLLRREEKIPGGLKYLLGRMLKVSHAETTTAEWCQRFTDILDAAGWPGEQALDSSEYQACEAWQELLRSVAKLDDMLGRVDASTVLSILRRMALQRTFQPETDELPIQLLGMLESAGLTFDSLWVAGMDAATWPPVANPEPWLPVSWQKQVGVPGASFSQVLDDATATVQAWAKSANEVVFSYPMARDGQPATAAFFLGHIKADQHALSSDDSANSPLTVVQTLTDPARSIFSATSMINLTDPAGPALDDASPTRGGARLFEDQAKCPFRSFALHRLLARPLEDPGLGLDAREQGTAFHDSIEQFWLQIKTREKLLQLLETPSVTSLESADEERTAEQNDALYDVLGECVDGALASLQHESAELLALERARLIESLHAWLRLHEATREPFEVVAVEREEEVSFNGLTLQLKVDRIDKLASGENIIIDYKTGSQNSAARWLDDRPSNAQLPLYATVVDGVDGICFAQVVRQDRRFIGKACEKNLIRGVQGPANLGDKGFGDTWQDNLDYWRQQLGRLADEISAGHAVVDPQPGACQHCHLSSLCRIDIHADDSAETGEGLVTGSPMAEHS